MNHTWCIMGCRLSVCTSHRIATASPSQDELHEAARLARGPQPLRPAHGMLAVHQLSTAAGRPVASPRVRQPRGRPGQRARPLPPQVQPQPPAAAEQHARVRVQPPDAAHGARHRGGRAAAAGSPAAPCLLFRNLLLPQRVRVRRRTRGRLVRRALSLELLDDGGFCG